MTTKARDIINSRYHDNWRESRYGSTRSTLFGKFYERVLRKWLGVGVFRVWGNMLLLL
jgi:hypothetical protein